MEPSHQAISAVVFLSSRMQIREAVRDALKKFSPIKPVAFHASSEMQDALDTAETTQQCLLVLDWEFGSSEISKVLKQLCGGNKRGSRPILLLAKTVSDLLVATGYEYQVSKVHTGDISVIKIIDLLKEISADEQFNLPLKSILLKVNRKREEGDWKVATELLQQLASKVPDNPKIIVELARNKIESENWDDALSLLEPLADLNPPNMRALQMLSRCQLKKGKFSDAKVTLKKAKIINPYNVDRLLMLGNVLLECQETTEAKQVFSEAGALRPGSYEATKGVGKCLLLEGEVNEALGLLKDLGSQKELASVFNSSAILTIRQGNHDAGISLYNSALDLSANTEEIKSRLLFNKGVGFRRWNKDGDAISCFKEALTLDSSFAKAKRSLDLLENKQKEKRTQKPLDAEQKHKKIQSELEGTTDDAFAEKRDLDGYHNININQDAIHQVSDSANESLDNVFDDSFDDSFDDDFDDDSSLDFL